MAQVVVICALIVFAISPLLRRLWIDRFWIPARSTVIRMEVRYSSSETPGWMWAPIIEYEAAGQRFTFERNYWQAPGAKPKYKTGDEFEILYNPRKPWRFVYKESLVHVFWTFATCFIAAY